MMARRRAGLTQRQLAELLGLRQATIARWERGDRGVSVDDVELVAHACGLQLDAHLLVEDRSWWPQIATQLELDPLERVRRLTPPGAPDIAAGLSELAAAGVFGLVIGEVAGALMAGRSCSVRRRSRYVGLSTAWVIASDRWALDGPGAAGTSCPAERASSSWRRPPAREAKRTSPATEWRSRHRPEPSTQPDSSTC